jgi:hypothetical protein
MKQDVSNFKEQMTDLVYEAGQVSRSITAISRMTDEFMNHIVSVSDRESALTDAGWAIQKLAKYQRDLLETLEVGLGNIDQVVLAKSTKVGIPEFATDGTA